MPYDEECPRHANGEPWTWVDTAIMWIMDSLVWLAIMAPGILLGFTLGWWGRGCRLG